MLCSTKLIFFVVYATKIAFMFIVVIILCVLLRIFIPENRNGIRGGLRTIALVILMLMLAYSQCMSEDYKHTFRY